MNLPENYAEWLDRARAEDPEALHWLYSVVRREVVTKVSFPPQVDPEELTSETVTALWTGIHRLRDPAKILRFARTVAKRIVSRKARELARFVPLNTEPATSSVDVPGRNIEGEELLGALSATLSAADQKLFRLLYVLGASNPEVQSDLGLSAPLLRKRKYRLNQKLRKAVDRFPE